MLKKLKELSKLANKVSLYTNINDTSHFLYGIILAVDENKIAVQLISPDGENDGIVAFDTEEVFRIELDGQYAEKMKKLSGNIQRVGFQLVENSIYLSVLYLAKQRNQIVSIELCSSGYDDVVGFVSGISEDDCCINQIDEYGFPDGCSYISLEDITQISCGGKTENRIYKLWKRNS